MTQWRWQWHHNGVAERAAYLSQRVYKWIKESSNLCIHRCCIGLWCSPFINFDKSFWHCLTVETGQHERPISTHFYSLSIVILKSWGQGISHRAHLLMLSNSVTAHEASWRNFRNDWHYLNTEIVRTLTSRHFLTSCQIIIITEAWVLNF